MFSYPILELLQDCEDPPLTPDILVDLQKRLGVTFPADYAEFLLQFNGGYFSRRVEFPVPYPMPECDLELLISFHGVPDYGIPDEELSTGLLSTRECLCDRIPETFLSIAATLACPDCVMINCTGPGTAIDGVWFWDSSAFYDERGPELHRICDSFTEFLSLLHHNVIDDYEHAPRETMPIFQVVERGVLSAVRTYLACGGDPETRNELDQTLLIAAVSHSWPKIVRLLLERGANPNVRDVMGKTPLHHASGRSFDSVKLLLAAGADAKARDADGKSVLAGWIDRNNHLLRKHGAVD